MDSGCGIHSDVTGAGHRQECSGHSCWRLLLRSPLTPGGYSRAQEVGGDQREEKKLETRVGTALLMTDKVKMPGEWKAEISASTRDETLHVGGGWAEKYRKTILY